MMAEAADASGAKAKKKKKVEKKKDPKKFPCTNWGWCSECEYGLHINPFGPGGWAKHIKRAQVILGMTFIKVLKYIWIKVTEWKVTIGLIVGKVTSIAKTNPESFRSD